MKGEGGGGHSLFEIWPNWLLPNCSCSLGDSPLIRLIGLMVSGKVKVLKV